MQDEISPTSEAATPAVTTASLTPYVPTLYAEVEEAVRRLLGLKDNVRIEFRSSKHEHSSGPIVTFTVHLPNGLDLDLHLAHPQAQDRAWRKGSSALLSYKKRKDGSDPLQDPKAAPSLEALGKLFLVNQRKDGEALGSALWQALEKVDRFSQIDDYMYRQISQGSLGLHAYLRLGFLCSQDCWFCWQGRDWPDAPTELYFKWLDEIAAAGVKHISFTGGEPTLHSALPELVAIAKQRYGMQTMIQTNAIRFRHKAFLAKMVTAGTDILFVSFHSHIPEVSDAMTRARGTNRTTVKGIEAALGAGLRVSLNCVVENANHDTLPGHAQFIVDRFVKPFPDNPANPISYSHPAAYHDRDAWEGSMVALDLVQPHLLAAARILRDAGIYPEVMGTCGFPPCLFHEDPGFIRLVDPADSASMDDMDTSSRAYGDACNKCAVKERCLGPRKAYIQRFGDRGLRPFAQVPDVPSYRWNSDEDSYDVSTTINAQ